MDKVIDKYITPYLLSRYKKVLFMRYLVRFYDIGALICFLAMMGCVVLEVFTRNVVHIPTTWAEESSRLFFVWAVFLGSASAWFRGAHIVVNVLPRRLTGRSRLILQLATQLLTAMFVLCTVFGAVWIMFISYPVKTTALEISISYFNLALFVGLTGIVVFHISQFTKTINSLRCKQHPEK